MRNKLLARNMISSLVFQIVTLVCGFVLPRFTLEYFGSEVNGLVNSITQFLQAISFLELGVGAVVQSSLYKPLAEADNVKVSQVLSSANKFFRRIATALFIYLLLLLLIYPAISNTSFSTGYVDLLLVIMCANSFAQYYFGIVDRILLNADQRGYIQYLIQSICVLINAVSCVVLMQFGQNIHVVKLATSVIYLVQPVIIRLYIVRHYEIDRRITYEVEPIKQKWNGITQHFSAIILESTDSIVLTIFSTLANVSIYSVYNMVVMGLKRVFDIVTNSFQSVLGELWAKQKLDELKKYFSWLEWMIHSLTVFIFGCSSILIIPFIQCYTSGIVDADYYQPVFATVLTVANTLHCLRLPYLAMIFAGGHYKETQKMFVVAAILNISISIVVVHFWGLVGVAVGTLIAMGYQTSWLAIYVSRNLVRWPLINSLKQLCVDLIIWILSTMITRTFVMNDITYHSWLLLAVETASVWICVAAIVNCIFCNKQVTRLLNKIKKQ